MKPKLLAPTQHAVFKLAADLLLVFKPRGHCEAPHVHMHRQRLHVLRGALRVHVGARATTVRPGSRALNIAAGRMHETLALQDTWLVAEAIPPRRRQRRQSAR